MSYTTEAFGGDGGVRARGSAMTEANLHRLWGTLPARQF